MPSGTPAPTNFPPHTPRPFPLAAPPLQFSTPAPPHPSPTTPSYNVQVGNGNVMDLSVTKDAGFGLWLFNGLVNVNIGPDGRWNMAPSAAAGGYGIASESGPVTVQGMQDPAAPALGQEAASAAAARMQAAPQAAPGSDVMQMQVPQQMPLQKQLQVQQAQQMPQQMPLPQHMQMPQQAQMPQQMPVPQQMQQQMPQQMQIFQQMPLPQQMQQQVPLLMQSPQDDMTGAPAARKACEGGIVVRVEDNGMGGQRYTCKYRAGSRPAAAA